MRPLIFGDPRKKSAAETAPYIFDFIISDAFAKFAAELCADLISRVLKIETCPLGFNLSIYVQVTVGATEIKCLGK